MRMGIIYIYLTHSRTFHSLFSTQHFTFSPIHLFTFSPLKVFCHFGDLGVHLVDELLDGLDALLATALRTYGYGAVGGFFLTDNDHIGDALQLVIADLTTQLLVAQVDGGTYPTLAELAAYLFGIVVVFL